MDQQILLYKESDGWQATVQHVSGDIVGKTSAYQMPTEESSRLMALLEAEMIVENLVGRPEVALAQAV